MDVMNWLKPTLESLKFKNSKFGNGESAILHEVNIIVGYRIVCSIAQCSIWVRESFKFGKVWFRFNRSNRFNLIEFEIEYFFWFDMFQTLINVETKVNIVKAFKVVVTRWLDVNDIYFFEFSISFGLCVDATSVVFYMFSLPLTSNKSYYLNKIVFQSLPVDQKSCDCCDRLSDWVRATSHGTKSCKCLDLHRTVP